MFLNAKRHTRDVFSKFNMEVFTFVFNI